MPRKLEPIEAEARYKAFAEKLRLALDNGLGATSMGDVKAAFKGGVPPVPARRVVEWFHGVSVPESEELTKLATTIAGAQFEGLREELLAAVRSSRGASQHEYLHALASRYQEMEEFDYAILEDRTLGAPETLWENICTLVEPTDVAFLAAVAAHQGWKRLDLWADRFAQDGARPAVITSLCELITSGFTRTSARAAFMLSRPAYEGKALAAALQWLDEEIPTLPMEARKWATELRASIPERGVVELVRHAEMAENKRADILRSIEVSQRRRPPMLTGDREVKSRGVGPRI